MQKQRKIIHELERYNYINFQPCHQRVGAFEVRGLGAWGYGVGCDSLTECTKHIHSLELQNVILNYRSNALIVLELVTGLGFLTFSDVVGSIS